MAYVRREICVSKAFGLALFLEGNLPFFFVLLCIGGQFPSTTLPRPWAYIWRGLFSEFYGILSYYDRVAGCDGSTPVSTVLRKSVSFFIINVFLIKKTFQVKVMLHETIRNDDF